MKGGGDENMEGEKGGEDTFTQPRCYLLSRGLMLKLRIRHLKLVVPPATSI